YSYLAAPAACVPKQFTGNPQEVVHGLGYLGFSWENMQQDHLPSWDEYVFDYGERLFCLLRAIQRYKDFAVHT
ncbi:MAG TPA: hypothetical protein VFA32_19775, partial [Dehalococcoidia bacterium]|nr:hypothetical protein [Dehalococcoidia bacterium]